MNGFRQFSLNPNVHLALSLLLTLASAIPQAAPFAGMLSTVATTLVGTGMMLPESGSLHQTDYAKIAQGVVDAIKAMPGRQ